jgi:hypothetical protein
VSDAAGKPTPALEAASGLAPATVPPVPAAPLSDAAIPVHGEAMQEKGSHLRHRASRWLRRALLGAALMFWTLVFLLTAFGNYERAVSVSGRTEVLALRADGTDFAYWRFHSAALLADPDGTEQRDTFAIRLEYNARVTFTRAGRGPLSIAFAGPPGKPGGNCPPGAVRVGLLQRDGRPDESLCDGARIVVDAVPLAAPLVLSLRGGVEVGEEVRSGAGAQPLLLEGQALLFARHTGPVSWFCQAADALDALCDRFVASRLDLAAGDSITFRAAQGKEAAATGFLRFAPDDLAGGLNFDVAAPSAALTVRRLKGEAFPWQESWFERIERSPILLALNGLTLALGGLVTLLGLERWLGGGGGHAAVFLLLLAPAAARADQAMVRAGETGQAMLRARGDRCYALTPAHVIGEESAALLTAAGRVRGEGDVLRRVPAFPEPFSLLTVRGLPPALCPGFEGPPALDALLHGRPSGHLRMVRAEGAIERLPLTILSVDVETLEVQLEGGAPPSQGMSGATIFLGEQPVGLLVDVDPAAGTGRVDRVFERLGPYFAATLPVAPLRASAASVPGQGHGATLEVVRWTAEPVTAANSARALTEQGLSPWRVPADARADVVLRLLPGTVMTGITLRLNGLPDPPRTVEIMGGRSESGPWQWIAAFPLEPGDREVTRSVAPIRLPYLMLRASGAQPGQETMALGGVRVESP